MPQDRGYTSERTIDIGEMLDNVEANAHVCVYTRNGIFNCTRNDRHVGSIGLGLPRCRINAARGPTLVKFARRCGRDRCIQTPSICISDVAHESINGYVAPSAISEKK